MTAPTDLPARLRELVRYAEAGGAPQEFITQTARTLAELLIERDELRRALGQSGLNALQAAHRQAALADRLKAEGLTGAELRKAVCERLGISRRTYYRRRGGEDGPLIGRSPVPVTGDGRPRYRLPAGTGNR